MKSVGQREEKVLGNTTRWVLMLPAAALCAAVAYGTIAIGLTALGYAFVGPLAEAVPLVAAAASTVASAAMGYVLVWAAVVIAPSRRGHVVQALIGVGSAVAAISIYDAAVASGATVQLTAASSLASGVGFIAGLLAAGFRLRHLRD